MRTSALLNLIAAGTRNPQVRSALAEVTQSRTGTPDSVRELTWALSINPHISATEAAALFGLPHPHAAEQHHPITTPTPARTGRPGRPGRTGRTGVISRPVVDALCSRATDPDQVAAWFPTETRPRVLTDILRITCLPLDSWATGRALHLCDTARTRPTPQARSASTTFERAILAAPALAHPTKAAAAVRLALSLAPAVRTPGDTPDDTPDDTPADGAAPVTVPTTLWRELEHLIAGDASIETTIANSENPQARALIRTIRDSVANPSLNSWPEADHDPEPPRQEPTDSVRTYRRRVQAWIRGNAPHVHGTDPVRATDATDAAIALATLEPSTAAALLDWFPDPTGRLTTHLLATTTENLPRIGTQETLTARADLVSAAFQKTGIPIEVRAEALRQLARLVAYFVDHAPNPGPGSVSVRSLFTGSRSPLDSLPGGLLRHAHTAVPTLGEELLEITTELMQYLFRRGASAAPPVFPTERAAKRVLDHITTMHERHPANDPITSLFGYGNNPARDEAVFLRWCSTPMRLLLSPVMATAGLTDAGVAAVRTLNHLSGRTPTGAGSLALRSGGTDLEDHLDAAPGSLHTAPLSALLRALEDPSYRPGTCGFDTLAATFADLLEPHLDTATLCATPARILDLDVLLRALADAGQPTLVHQLPTLVAATLD